MDAWEVPPEAGAGCPIDESRWPGWRVVVEALTDQFAPAGALDRYGSDVGGTYGDDPGIGDVDYGAPGGVDPNHPTWTDITTPTYSVVIQRGARDGQPESDVDQIDLDLYDPDGTYLPMTGGGIRPSTTIRVSVLDPGDVWHPLGTAVVETTEDEHDTIPRLVRITAYGTLTLAVSTLPQWTRPPETTSERIEALLTGAAWTWGGPPVPPHDLDLLPYVEPFDAVVRDVLDHVAVSSRSELRTTPLGTLRLDHWPASLASTPDLAVTDCSDGAGLPVPALVIVEDGAEVLNYGIATNLEEPPVLAEARSYDTLGQFGWRTQALGFPLEGLLTADPVELQDLVTDAVSAYALGRPRVAEVRIDARLDPAWIDALADLDLGQTIEADRTGVIPRTYSGVLCGLEHRLQPGAWDASLYLTSPEAPPTPADCTLVMVDTFEDVSGWTIGTSTASGREGNGMSVGGSSAAVHVLDPASEGLDVTLGFSWRTGNLAAQRLIAQLRNAAGQNLLSIVALTTGALRVLSGGLTGGTLGTTATGLVTAATWHYIELQTKLDEVDGTIELLLDGVVVLSLAAVDTNGSGTPDPSPMRQLALAGGGSGNTTIYDDAYMSMGVDCTPMRDEMLAP